NSAYRSSRCCVSSSAMSVSWPGSSSADESRSRTARRQSGATLGWSGSRCGRRSRIAHPHACDLADRARELLPALALLLEDGRAGGEEAIVTSPSLAGLLHPSTSDPAAFLHAIEQRIECGGVKREHALRSLLDQFGNLIPVPRLVLEHGKDEKFGAALL